MYDYILIFLIVANIIILISSARSHPAIKIRDLQKRVIELDRRLQNTETVAAYAALSTGELRPQHYFKFRT